jgi:hypothetical protein
MAIKTFTTGEVLTAADTNTYLANSGLVYITSQSLTTSATNVVGCFTSAYTNYRVVIDSMSVSAAADIYFRLLSGTTPASGANYDYAMYSVNAIGTSANVTAAADTYGFSGISITGAGVGGTVFASASLDVFMPQLNLRTPVFANAIGVIGGTYGSRSGMSVHATAGVYDGIRIDTRSAVTMTGTITVYGYRKA